MKKRYVAIVVAVMGILLIISIGAMLYAFVLHIKANERLNRVQELYEQCKLESKEAE